MSFWLQHAYGKSDRIEQLQSRHLLDGIVLSPANESREALRTTAATVVAAGGSALLDPQLYVHTIPNGTAKYHPDHHLDFATVHWSMAPDDISRQVDVIRRANAALGLTIVCSPAPLQSTFTDAWTALAFQYARATIGRVGAENVYVSLVIEESAFADWEGIEEWLDVATQLEVLGFYIVVSRRDNPYPHPYQPERLANLFRLIYRLGVVNEYQVILGYSDIEGLVAVALGGSMATGWYYSQRRFTEGRWQPSTGGRAPIPRVFSEPLLSPLLIQEAQGLARSSDRATVFPDATLRTAITTGSWGLTESQSQHLRSMAQVARSIASGDSPETRLNAVVSRVRRARTRLTGLRNSGSLAAVSYGTRLGALEDSIGAFRSQEEV